MPELAEVETIARQLTDLASASEDRPLGAKTMDWSLAYPQWTATSLTQFNGKHLGAVERRGKKLFWSFGDSPEVLVMGLGMTGTFSHGPLATPVPKHLIFSVSLADHIIYYSDARHFSKGRTYATMEDAIAGEKQGKDAWTHSWTLKEWGDVLRSSKPLKAILLDQGKIGGIGNYLADEICYDAKLSPLRSANSLTKNDMERLNTSLRKIIGLALQHRGATFRNYRDIEDRRGAMARTFQVYGRKGQKCNACASDLVTTEVAGRTTVYCPSCQS